MMEALRMNNVLQQNNISQFSGEDIGIAMSQHRLDEMLTMIGGNSLFYQLFPFASESDNNLKTLLASSPQAFETLKNNFLKVSQKATCDICLLSDENVHLRVTGNIEGDILYLTYLDISDFVIENKNLLSQKSQQIHHFEWMLSEYPNNVYVSDMDNYELLYLNENSCNTLQDRFENLVGRKCYEVIQGRTSPCPFCTNKYLKDNETYEWEFYNPILERTFMIKNRMLDWHGHRARIELSYDMYSTEYKLAKKDLERNAILSTIPGGLARVDARDLSTVLWYGGEFLTMIGYTKEQFENEIQSQCASYVHADDLDHAIEVMQESRMTGQPTICESRIVTRDGQIKILTMTFSYVSGEESWDGIASFYSVGIDITKERQEQERQNQALKDAYQAVQVASSAKTNFLSSMSHDIRTPMNAIIGMTAIAQAHIDSPEKINNCLNKINVSSRHLLSLVNEVLDISKIESGKIDLNLETVDLSKLVETIYDMSKSLTSRKNQEFKIFIEGVQHEKIITDGDRLKQIFMNLISNAVKYTPEGGHIILQIKEYDSLIQGKGFFEFSFSDDGIGIDESFIPNLFKPFARAEDSRISKIQGTGLGLAITDNIVKMMNGTIEVYTQVGEGSQFIVSLPLEYVDEKEQTDEELVGQSVLVVDDDQIVCENAALLLNELGMKSEWVLNGYDAIDRIKEAHYKKDDYFAIILDWKMPDLNGLETIRIIKNQLWKEIPVIVISAYDLSDIEEDFIEAGADAFITKPLFKSKMLHVLELFCSSHCLDHCHEQVKEVDKQICGQRILVVEDNELNREIAMELLSMRGLLVESAVNGEQAVEMFQSSKPGYYSAILMDIQMPVMDGYQATSIIRHLKRSDAQSVPILALSANVFVSDIKDAQSVGMNDYISKPIDADELIKILQKYIG